MHDIPFPEVRQLLDFAAKPERSCVSLRKNCDGDASHPCAILESFVSGAEQHACACHSAEALMHTVPAKALAGKVRSEERNCRCNGDSPQPQHPRRERVRRLVVS